VPDRAAHATIGPARSFIRVGKIATASLLESAHSSVLFRK
jgi:hypothetical protein